MQDARIVTSITGEKYNNNMSTPPSEIELLTRQLESELAVRVKKYEAQLAEHIPAMVAWIHARRAEKIANYKPRKGYIDISGPSTVYDDEVTKQFKYLLTPEMLELEAHNAEITAECKRRGLRYRSPLCVGGVLAGPVYKAQQQARS